MSDDEFIDWFKAWLKKNPEKAMVERVVQICLTYG